MFGSHPIGNVRVFPSALTLIVTLSLVPLATTPLRAASWGLTQHGGRATAQAGAFVARADDPSAVTYNPAGIARLDGFQLQLGVDALNLDGKAGEGAALPELDDSTDILPAAYLTYRLPGRANRVVLGLGVDSPRWTSLQWKASVPQIYQSALENSVELWQVHPVAAVRLTDRWSLGGGLRYVSGDLTYRFGEAGRLGTSPDNTIPFEVSLTADGGDSDLGFDLGLQYTAPRWGWGAVYRQGVSLTSDDPGRLNVVSSGFPALPDIVNDLFGNATIRQNVELPDEIITGGWFALRPKLRLELDLAYTDSSTSRILIRNRLNVINDPFNGEFVPLGIDTRDETWSVRLGAEGELGAHWLLSGGLAWEQSPTPNGDASFVSPWGDAMVYAVGASYRLPSVTFDAGYSYWDHDDLESRFILEGFPTTNGSFETSEQILSVSARWSF